MRWSGCGKGIPSPKRHNSVPPPTMKFLSVLQTPAAVAVATLLIFAVAALHAQAIPLNEANTAEAEFRAGAAGKVAVMFKFADGKVQTLLGAVKPDELKRTVEKDGRKVPETTPMADGWI